MLINMGEAMNQQACVDGFGRTGFALSIGGFPPKQELQSSWMELLLDLPTYVGPRRAPAAAWRTGAEIWEEEAKVAGAAAADPSSRERSRQSRETSTPQLVLVSEKNFPNK